MSSGGRRLVGIDDMVGEILNTMQEYAETCTADVKEVAKEVAKDTIKELKQTSPEGTGSRKGHYKDGWTSKVESKDSMSINIGIYNKKKPGLTHLLEKGYAKRGGDRVEGIPHIGPAEKHAINAFEERMKERLSR